MAICISPFCFLHSSSSSSSSSYHHLLLPMYSSVHTPPPTILNASFKLILHKPFFLGHAHFIPPLLCTIPKTMRASIEARKKGDPLKVMIAGTPQFELIANKYGLVHISTEDLLRAEVAAGTKSGEIIKEYMGGGQLVPDDIVARMIKERLAQPDVQKNGWLLDGYPRSLTQAQALEVQSIRPDILILLDTHNEGNEEILSVYRDCIHKVDGNSPKDLVCNEIDKILRKLTLDESLETGALVVTATDKSSKIAASVRKKIWKGIPTRMNTIPHSREIRQYFYKDVCAATKNAIEDGIHKLKVQVIIPELNPEMDVYRIGTLLELMREIAFTFAYDGKRVKVCVQGSMGEGIFSGMPLQLAGTRRMLEFMDWGEYEAKENFIKFGSIGANDIHENDDLFILMAPQNAVGNCIIEDLQAMVNAAGQRPVIIVNPRLKDLPSASGVMQTRGREGRMEFVKSFFTCYNFRFLYTSGTQYPILGALRMAYPSQYELYRRVDLESGKEKYLLFETFDKEPTTAEITDAFAGRLRRNQASPAGIWGLLSSWF